MPAVTHRVPQTHHARPAARHVARRDGALLGLRSLLEQAEPLARASDETLEELRSSMEEALSQVGAEQRQRLRSRPAHHCQICAEQPVNCVFAPCGHMCACVLCAYKVQRCPICRSHIHQVVETFAVCVAEI